MTPLDRVAPPVAVRVIARFGVAATLKTLREGEKTAAGIKITPPRTRRLYIPSTRVEELVSACLVAARDPKLLEAEFPEPKSGDELTVPSIGRTFQLVEGTIAIRSGEHVAVYRLVWRA